MTWIGAHDAGLDVQWYRGHRQHPAAGVEQTADQVQTADGVPEQIPQRDDQQVTDSVPTEVTVAGEPVLEDVAPLVAPFGVIAQRRQCHPQISWWENVELVPQPSAGAAIVGDRHHRSDPVGDQPQCREGGSKAVPPAEGNDCRAGHSRPRSRWTRNVATCSALILDARASATATERCLPPVQPTARVT